jgi:beta-galactosidase
VRAFVLGIRNGYYNQEMSAISPSIPDPNRAVIVQTQGSIGFARASSAALIAVLLLFWGGRSVAHQYMAPASNRADLNLDSSWQFNLGDVTGAQNTNFDDSSWITISLPHTWNNLDGQDGGNNYYRGIGWYRRHYVIDGANAGRELFLKFDGASLVANVYVNGAFVGEHQEGFSAFVFDVTSYLNVGGDNVIAVKVNNAFNAGIPPMAADFTFFGGPYRHVHLLALDKLHVTPLDYGSPGICLQQSVLSATFRHGPGHHQTAQ